MKLCSTCKSTKTLKEFTVLRSSKDGYSYRCRDCERNWRNINWESKKLASDKYRQNNLEKIQEKARLSAKKRRLNPNKRNELNNKTKIWKQKNKEKVREYNKQYKMNAYKTNPSFKLKMRIRTRLGQSLKVKKWNKNNTFVNYIGCDEKFLKSYLESQFQFGMTWENHGKWEIDHIIPLLSADNVEHIYQLCHYTNLQPLWKHQHVKKTKKDQEKIKEHKNKSKIRD